MRRVAILALFMIVRTAHARPDPDDLTGGVDDNFGSDAPAAPEVDNTPRPATPYWLHGKLDGITAKIGMRYHLDVAGPNRANDFQIKLPTGGVATAATLTVDGVVHRLTLDATEQAEQVFGELSTAPTGPHRHWEILIANGTVSDLGG